MTNQFYARRAQVFCSAAITFPVNRSPGSVN
jgi:hypothetical protein